MKALLLRLAVFFLALLLTAQATVPYVYYLPVILKNPPPPPKKGIAVFGPYADTGCADAESLDAPYWYNWWTHPNSICSKGFIPMLYMAVDLKGNPSLQRNLLRFGGESGYILGFNEPNLPWQGNTTPKAGAAAWKQLEDLVVGTDIKLVSPAPSQHRPGELDPYGHSWLLAMIREYEKLYGTRPRFDAIGLHYYGDPAATKAFLLARHAELAPIYPDATVWVTEMNNCIIGSGNWAAYMQQMLPWFSDQPWIGKYFWFLNRPTDQFPETKSPCTLMGVHGSLTNSGAMYNSLGR